MPLLPRYSPAAQLFHWLSALLVAAAWILGVFGDAVADGPQETAEFAHILAGEAVVALLVLRIAWRFITPVAKTRTPLGRFIDLLGAYTHFALYALLLLVFATGLVTLFLDGAPLPLAGLIDIPSPWPRSREVAHNAGEIHEAIGHALILLALLHASAALVHHFVLKDDVLRRMTPRL